MRRVLEVLVWWALLVGVYAVLVTTVSPGELAVAVGAGGVASVAAVLSRRAERAAYRPRLGWLRWVLPLPLAVVTDTARLAGHLWRGLVLRRDEPGRSEWVPLPPAEGAVGSARRALAAIVLSATPASYVAEVRAGEGGPDAFLVHRLGAAGALERAVTS